MRYEIRICSGAYRGRFSGRHARGIRGRRRRSFLHRDKRNSHRHSAERGGPSGCPDLSQRERGLPHQNLRAGTLQNRLPLRQLHRHGDQQRIQGRGPRGRTGRGLSLYFNGGRHRKQLLRPGHPPRLRGRRNPDASGHPRSVRPDAPSEEDEEDPPQDRGEIRRL